MFEIIGKVIVYGGGGLLVIALVFFAIIGFMMCTNWK